jgi:hypothetical protein
MIDQKTAFLAGVSRRCKEAHMDGADEEQVARLLLMPQKKAACVIGQIMADKREELVKQAEQNLVKLADIGGFEQTVQNPLNAPKPEPEEPGPAPTPAPAQVQMPSAPVAPPPSQPQVIDLSEDPAVQAMIQQDRPQPAPAPPEAPPAAPPAAPPSAPPAGGKDPQREAIARGFGYSLTPFMRSQNVTGDWLEQQQRRAIEAAQDWQTVRNLQKIHGGSSRPVRGGLRASDINPSLASDPDERKRLEVLKNYIARRESSERARIGLRSGWSTMGSGFRGGGERAIRGRQPTPIQATQQASAAPAEAPASELQGQVPAGGQVAAPTPTGTASFTMSEGAGPSVTGTTPVTAAPKAWTARGSTEATSWDPTSRSLEMSYTPPGSQAPTPPPPAQAFGTQSQGARGMQTAVNKQMQQQSGMATPPPPPAALTQTPAPAAPEGAAATEMQGEEEMTTPSGTVGSPGVGGAFAFRKRR